MQRRLPTNWLLHLFLFAGTFITTTVFGFALVESFRENRPLDATQIYVGYVHLIHLHWSVLRGLQFSIPFLLILLAHEFGHYFICRTWNVAVSLPYFLPSPTFLGTFGAFIRIRSPIYSRRSLFDIGFSGPVAGFLVLLPFLVVGVLLSRVSCGIALHGDFLFGTPLGLRLVEAICFPGVATADIALHPVARAAWAGLLATAMNLLPIGQLDGGHILYALVGHRHRTLSQIFLVILLPLGFFFYWGWLFWAAILFILGRRTPMIYDQSPVDHDRRWLGILAAVIFICSFSLAPVQVG